MKKLVIALCALMSMTGSAASAQERVTLGWGRLFTNDVFGDTRDRWRTGSYALSRVRGAEWSGALPATPGEILEFRAVGETIAPADLVSPDPSDRRYVGSLTLGLHTQFDWQGFETSMGVNLVATGERTGASRMQGRIHDWLGLPEPQVFGDQIGNHVYPTALVELGRRMDLPGGALRPFVEAQAGVEDFVRLGADLSFGGYA